MPELAARRRADGGKCEKCSEKLPLCLSWPGRKAAGRRSFTLEHLCLSEDVYLAPPRRSVRSLPPFPS